MIEIRKADADLIKILPPVKIDKNVRYCPSQFVLSFEHKGKNYLFNSLTKQCIEESLPASAFVGEGYDELIKSLFLVPSGKDECKFYNSLSSIVRVYNQKKGSKDYIIFPTTACNAKCAYCFEEGMKQMTMSSEVVEQTIQFILGTHENRVIGLSWFGGEPLLSPHIIDRICEGIREARQEYHSSMISNGSLITPEIVGKMKANWNLTHIQISMDGAEKDYISRKRYNVYKDYYHKVIKSVNILSDAGINVSIRCNVDEDNWGSIHQFIKDLEISVINREKVSLYFAPLNQVRKGNNDISMWEKIVEAQPVIDAAGFKKTSLLVFTKGFRINHCMADNDDYVITPDGSLYPCEHCPPGSRFGDIWHGSTNENAKREFCRVDITREKCRNCPFLPNCTSFATCPIEDTHCREIQEMLTINMIKAWIDKMEEHDMPDCGNPLC